MARRRVAGEVGGGVSAPPGAPPEPLQEPSGPRGGGKGAGALPGAQETPSRARKVAVSGGRPPRKAAEAETRVSGAALRLVPVEGAARVLTVEGHDPVWRGSVEGAAFGREEWRGAFVRLRPPVSTEDAVVMAVREAVMAAGAVAVRVMPRARAVVTAARSASGRTSVRETVMRMVAEARTQDRDALREAVELAMGAVGL